MASCSGRRSAPRVLLVALIFFLNCIAGPLSTIAAPFVLRTVGALSNETTLLFSSLVWCTSLAGVLVGLLLIDRISRRRLLYIAVIPEACAALFMAIAGPGHPPLLVIGFFAFSFFSWLGPAVLTWVWSSELFPTRLRGRSQGFCNAACRLAISINIFLIPVGVAALGFTTSIIILSIPLFALGVTGQSSTAAGQRTPQPRSHRPVTDHARCRKSHPSGCAESDRRPPRCGA